MGVEASSVSEQEKADAVEANRDATDTPPAGRGDPKPRPRGRGGKRPGAGRPKGAKTGTSSKDRKPSSAAADRALQESLAQLLVLPAVPSALVTPSAEGKQFLTGHFTTQAPIAAAQLVELSKQSPELRAALEKITTASVTMGLVTLAVGYAAPPVLWIIGQRGMAQGLSMFASLTPEQLAELALMAETERAAQGATLSGDGTSQAPPPKAPVVTAEQTAADAIAAAQAAAQYPSQ